ncbi:MAG: PEFG-CTERM sorting domain-containing protein [Nitrosopumilaceae archaeon]|nr:PEFG-CTERM sorting domain-containing protein [Nitrosopumilaceae archaeon]
MKNRIFVPLVALFVIIMITNMPSSHAESVTISIPSGTSSPGCEETNECYIPNNITIHPGDTVVWTNDDSAAHTVTSGTAEDGPDGKFDSSLFPAGETYSTTLQDLGEYPYFCMVHPWMTGNVFVTVGGGVEVDLQTITVGEGDPDKTTVTSLSNDGKVRVEITSTNPEKGTSMSLSTSFRNFNGGGLIKHVNYDIMATQNGKNILSDLDVHEHDGTGNHMTSILESDSPVEFTIIINGIGLPDEKNNWTGPKGETVTFKIVPEFGTIAVLILSVAIITAIIFTARTKLAIPKFP